MCFSSAATKDRRPVALDRVRVNHNLEFGSACGVLRLPLWYLGLEEVQRLAGSILSGAPAPRR